MTFPRWPEFLRLDLDRHRIARSFFLRGLGVIYLIAFLSWFSQVTLLVGPDGLEPAQTLLDSVGEAFSKRGENAFFALPTLFWFTGASDFALQFACMTGILLSGLVIFGRFTGPSLVGLWILYLSLVQTGGIFMSYQWDILLLETGFLSLFFCSWRMRSPWRNPFPLNLLQKIALVFFWVLIAKLMFFSGWVKLAWASDLQPEWWPDRTALHFHYMTQPLPTWTAWHAHHAPEGIHSLSIWIMYFVELVLPFAILLGRWGRVTAAIGFAFLMTGILLTGNYTYFNWLTLLLCIPLIPDRAWPKWIRNGLEFSPIGLPAPLNRQAKITQAAIACLGLGALGLLQVHVVLTDLNRAPNPMLKSDATPQWLDFYASAIAPFRIASGYGLFRTMTTTRPEIILEGSDDGENWVEYDFAWKVDDRSDRPRFIAPHQPRVAWQFWFAALDQRFRRDRPNARWIENLVIQLLQGDIEAERLLKHNPFPEKPPRFLRMLLYDYEFTTPEEKSETGHWWKRTLRGTYLRPVALKSNTSVR